MPPCSGTERKLVNWRIPLCWNSQLKYIIPPSPPQHPALRYEYYTRPCDDENYCTVQYEYCVDALGAIHYEVNSYILTGFPDCEDAEDIILPIIIGQTSDCFIYHTPCNP